MPGKTGLRSETSTALVCGPSMALILFTQPEGKSRLLVPLSCRA
jgi:hypothetical protein